MSDSHFRELGVSISDRITLLEAVQDTEATSISHILSSTHLSESSDIHTKFQSLAISTTDCAVTTSKVSDDFDFLNNIMLDGDDIIDTNSTSVNSTKSNISSGTSFLDALNQMITNKEVSTEEAWHLGQTQKG